MADIKNIKVGNTTYGLRDDTALQNLTAAQETTLLSNGIYNGEVVANGTVFTTEAGVFTQFEKIEHNDLIESGSTFSKSGPQLFASKDRFLDFVTNSATYYYSQTGAQGWESGTLLATAGTTQPAVIDDGSKLFVVFFGSNKAFISEDDGLSFTYSGVATSGITSSAYLNTGYYLSKGLYVAVPSGQNAMGCATSTDGLTWTDRYSSLPVTTNGSSFVSDGEYVYLIAYNTGNVYKTTDCETWTSVGTSTFFPSNGCLHYYQGKFWGYKASGDSNHVFSTLKYSTDLLTWTDVPSITPLPSGATSLRTTYRLGYCGSNTAGLFVIYCTDNNVSSYYVAISNDGITWSVQSELSGYRGGRFLSKGNGSLFLIASSFNKSYIGSPVPYYTYSLTPLSYDKDEVDALISGSGGSLTDIAQAGSNIAFSSAAYGVTNVGGVTLTSGVASGFGDAKYLEATVPNENGVIYYFKINTGTRDRTGVIVEIGDDLGIKLVDKGNGNYSYYFKRPYDKTYQQSEAWQQQNTDKWFKIEITSSVVLYWISSDGSSYSHMDFSYTPTGNQELMRLGQTTGTFVSNEYFSGSIDLNVCYGEKNSVNVWDGYNSSNTKTKINAVVSPASIASVPSTDGTYIPVLTVSSGVATISWTAYTL